MVTHLETLQSFCLGLFVRNRGFGLIRGEIFFERDPAGGLRILGRPFRVRLRAPQNPHLICGLSVTQGGLWIALVYSCRFTVGRRCDLRRVFDDLFPTSTRKQRCLQLDR